MTFMLGLSIGGTLKISAPRLSIRLILSRSVPCFDGLRVGKVET
jgi:hypothetical protein